MTKTQRRAAKRFFSRPRREQPIWTMYFKATTAEQGKAIKAAKKK